MKTWAVDLSTFAPRCGTIALVISGGNTVTSRRARSRTDQMIRYDDGLDERRSRDERLHDAMLDMRAAAMEIADILGESPYDELMRCPLAGECAANQWRERGLADARRKRDTTWMEAPR